MPQQISGRKPWLDALRALAILFVMYGHMIQGQTIFFVFTSPVKIPLFFAITGYLFKDRGGDFKLFLKTLFRSLVIPWLFLSCLPVICLSLFFGFSYFTTEIFKIFSGERIWYMPCCIAAEIIWFLLRKYLKCQRWLGVAVAGCFAIGLILSEFGILDFFMINRAFVVQLYIWIGYLYKCLEEKISKLNWKCLLLGGVGYIGLCVISLVAFPNSVMDIHRNEYYNLPFCLLLIFLGIFTCFAVASRLKYIPKFLSFIGKNTLVFYIWAVYASWFINKALQLAGIELNTSSLLAVAHTAMQCVICGIAALILNKLLPEAVGKKRISYATHATK